MIVSNPAKPDGIAAVIFDLYNTLIYAGSQIHPHKRLFAKLGFSQYEMIIKRRLLQTRDMDVYEIVGLAADIEDEEIEDELVQFHLDLDQELHSIRAYPETVRVLRRLKDQGYRLGLISNLAAPYKQPVFDLGLDQYFDQMMFSCDVGAIKPDPYIYRLMMMALGLEPGRLLMTGDQFAKDVEAPRQLGMKAVLLDRLGKAPDSIGSLEGIFDYL